MRSRWQKKCGSCSDIESEGKNGAVCTSAIRWKTKMGSGTALEYLVQRLFLLNGDRSPQME